MIRIYHTDPFDVLPIESIEVNPNLTDNKEPILIKACEINHLRNKQNSLSKGTLDDHSKKEATRGREEDTRTQYPHLFQD